MGKQRKRSSGEHGLLPGAAQRNCRAYEPLQRKQGFRHRGLGQPQGPRRGADPAMIADRHQDAAMANFQIVCHWQPIGLADAPIVTLEACIRSGNVRCRV